VDYKIHDLGSDKVSEDGVQGGLDIQQVGCHREYENIEYKNKVANG
jgi:hypothetical protein